MDEASRLTPTVKNKWPKSAVNHGSSPTFYNNETELIRKRNTWTIHLWEKQCVLEVCSLACVLFDNLQGLVLQPATRGVINKLSHFLYIWFFIAEQVYFSKTSWMNFQKEKVTKGCLCGTQKEMFVFFPQMEPWLLVFSKLNGCWEHFLGNRSWV